MEAGKNSARRFPGFLCRAPRCSGNRSAGAAHMRKHVPLYNQPVRTRGHNTAQIDAVLSGGRFRTRRSEEAFRPFCGRFRLFRARLCGDGGGHLVFRSSRNRRLRYGISLLAVVIGTVEPSGYNIFRSVPEYAASMVITSLSVSISKSGSPARILSPSLCSHRVIKPSVI